MYVKYNAVLRGGQGGLLTGGTRYSATIHLICSGLRKLSRKTKVPEGLLVYRGNGGMALPLDFLESDTQVYSLYIHTHTHTHTHTPFILTLPFIHAMLTILSIPSNCNTLTRATQGVWSARSCQPPQ